MGLDFILNWDMGELLVNNAAKTAEFDLAYCVWSGGFNVFKN